MATSRETKKFLNQAGVGTLWGKILEQLDTKQNVIDAEHKLAASLISVQDTAGNFTGETVEAVLAEIGTAIETAGAVTVAKTVGGADDSFVSKYVFSQNGSPIENGTIEIGKDMVATSGELVYGSLEGSTFTPSESGAAYIKMTIANGTPFYISVASLIEYNTFSNNNEIEFTDSNHTITASIAAGSISREKVNSNVLASLNLADSALQVDDIDSGSENGSISVAGTDVFVTGLGSAAYTDASAYATAAQGALAASAVQSVAEGATNGTISVDGSDVSVHGLGTAAYTNSTAYDAAGAADAVKGAASDAADAITVYGARAHAIAEATAVYDAVIALTDAEINSAIADATASHNA